MIEDITETGKDHESSAPEEVGEESEYPDFEIDCKAIFCSAC